MIVILSFKMDQQLIHIMLPQAPLSFHFLHLFTFSRDYGAMSQLAMGCVTCHTCHGCVMDFRPILGNLVEATHVTSPGHVYIFPC